MDKLQELNQGRQEFLAPCDYVASVPLTWFLKGASEVQEAIVLPLFPRVFVGISTKVKNNETKINFANSQKILSFPSIQAGYESFSEEFTTKLSVFVSNAKLNISDRILKSVAKSECRIWLDIPFNNHGLSIYEDASTALAFLVYCIENNLTQKEIDKEKDTLKFLLKASREKKVDIVGIIKDNRRSNRFIELFKFCWSLQPYNNGASCFTALLGTPLASTVFSAGSRECFGYQILHPSIDIAQMQETKNLLSFFKYVDEVFKEGSVWINSIKDATANFELLLVQSREKKDKFWGPVLLPFFFDEVIESRLTMTAAPDEKWERSFSCSEESSLEFFAPGNVIKNVSAEIESLKNSCILYSSERFHYPWGKDGAKLEPIEREAKEIPIDKLREVNFTGNEVRTSGEKPLSKQYPWEIIEQLILQGKIHWLWGFVFLTGWTSGEMLERLPKDQFANYISKEIKRIRGWGFDIHHKRGADEWRIDYRVSETKVRCNLLESRMHYQAAIRNFRDDVKQAIKDLELAISPLYYPHVNFIDAYNLLAECIFKINFVGISDNLLTRIEYFYRWYVRRLDEALFIIHKKYLKNGIFSEKEAGDDLNGIEFALKDAKKKLEAIQNKVAISPKEKEFEDLANLIYSLRKAIEEVSDESRMGDIVFETDEFIAFKNNRYIKEAFKMSSRFIDEMNVEIYDKESEVDFMLLNIVKYGIDFTKNNSASLIRNSIYQKLKENIIALAKAGRPLREKLGYELDKIKPPYTGKRILPRHPEAFDDEKN